MLRHLNLLLIFLVLLWTGSASELIELDCDNDRDCEMFKSAAVRSTCSDGTCRCELTDGGNETDCKPVIVKSSNQIGGQCPCHAENSVCNEKTQLCMCKEGFIPSREGKKCLSKAVALGKDCETDEQCIMNDHFSHCDDVRSNCACSNHFVIYQNSCHSIIASGELPCKKDSECANRTANSFCHEQQCICEGGFVANAENTTCLPVAHYEQQCSDSNQCIAQLGIGSLCSEGQCVCNEQYFAFPIEAHNSTTKEGHKIHLLCKRKVTHGASCNTDQECYQFHRGPHEQTMECFMNECVCSRGFFEKGGICISKSNSSTIHVSSLMLLLLLIALYYTKQSFTC